ncbi:MAG: DPP IV N-terminal domain-containing protein, partial [Bacteroidota bacterium]
MKRKICGAVLALLFTVPVAFAQSQEMTLKDAVLRRGALSPENIRNLSWIPETEKFGYVKQIAGEWSLLAGTPQGTAREQLASLEELNTALKAAGLEERTSFPRMRFIAPTAFRFSSARTLYRYDWAAKQVEKLNTWGEGAANVDINPQHGIAYTVDNNLFISLPENAPEAVTQSKDLNVRHGEAAHRYEFGISKGTFWSPDGKLLAFYRVDENMVTNYPMLNLRKKPATHEIIKYPFAGEKSHHASVGVYDTERKTTIYLQTGGDPEHYLTNITWSPDSKEIYVAELSRGQDAMKLNRYSSRNGELIGNVFSENDPKYVEPKHGPRFLPGSSDEFIWQSMRNGYNHLYHYKNDGTLVQQLTQGEFTVTSLLGFDEKGKTCFISAAFPNPTERRTFAVDLKKAEMKALTPLVG